MEKPICDLVLLSWNHIEETKPCLESLFRCTRTPSRLIIVDNGSELGVRAYLRSVHASGSIQEVILLQNETNEGFPTGMNRGIRASKSPYICLLNNDLLFSLGWLEEMISVAESNRSVGVVNPTSGNFNGRVPVGRDFESSAEQYQKRKGLYREVGTCTAFCMLIKREVIERVGFLSDEVERIFFEDEDFSMRAKRASFQCVAADGSFVYHAEHKTLRHGQEREALFNRNRQWCHKKWGRWVRVAWTRFTPIEQGSAESKKWLERLVEWARCRAYINVYSPRIERVSEETVFRSFGLIPHADIRWFGMPERLARWIAAARILERRKKLFDIIVSGDSAWVSAMERLRWIHRADVVLEDDQERLSALWKQKSKFRL